MDAPAPAELRSALHRRAARRRPWALALAPLFAVLAGCGPSAPPLGDDDAIAVFERLHRAIYGVYGAPFERDALYDLLLDSFADEALTAEYVEHFTTLSGMRRDDTKVTILRVDYTDVAVLRWEGGRPVIEADWNVGGVVYHQGHSHTRINRYQALYTLGVPAGGPAAGADGDALADAAPARDDYRIVDTKMKNMERVQLDMMSGNFGVDAPLPTSGQGMLSPSDLLRAGMVPSTSEGEDGEEGEDEGSGSPDDPEDPEERDLTPTDPTAEPPSEPTAEPTADPEDRR